MELKQDRLYTTVNPLCMIDDAGSTSKSGIQFSHKPPSCCMHHEPSCIMHVKEEVRDAYKSENLNMQAGLQVPF
jgi:hypothetical protein